MGGAGFPPSTVSATAYVVTCTTGMLIASIRLRASEAAHAGPWRRGGQPAALGEGRRRRQRHWLLLLLLLLLVLRARGGSHQPHAVPTMVLIRAATSIPIT